MIMKKGLLVSLMLMGSLFASSGQEVYEAKCAACHQIDMKMDMSMMQGMREKMQNATQEERQAMRKTMQEQMKKKMKEAGVRAPAMKMIAMRIKKMKGDDRDTFVAFVKDYIQNPSPDKGVCMPMAYKNFGVMPPIGKGMSEEERLAVSEWLYDNFKDASWDDSMGGKMCDKRNAKMKCGSGKCGGQNNNNMKCGSGKCGSK